MRIKRPFMLLCILIIILCIVKYCFDDKISPAGVLPKEAVTLEGRIDTWEVRNGQTILYLSNIYFYDDSVKEITHDNSIGIRCYIEGNHSFKLGQKVAVQGFLSLPETAGNPGEFDAATYYKSKGYDYVLYKGNILVKGNRYDVILQGLDCLRQYAKRQLQRYLAPEDAGILSAMLLGDKSNMEAETKELYRTVGIYHILAISGLHISMIGGCIYKILKILRIKPVWAVLLSLCMLTAYGIMIGMPPSAFRAIVMFGFGLIAPLLYRSHDKLTSMAFAAACMAVWEPLLMYDAGVQLSFLAVLGIVVLYPTFLGIHKHHMQIADGVWVSFAITYMTLPVIMYTYYEVPVYSLFANVCVLPFVPFLIALGLGIIFVGGVWSLPAKIAATVIHIILLFYDKLLQLVACLPGTSYVTGAPPIHRIWLFYVILGITIWVILKVKRKMLIRSLLSENAYEEGRQKEYIKEQVEIRRIMRNVRVIQIAVMVLLIIMLVMPQDYTCRITFLDVGQGDGICVETRNEVYLIDCGSTSKEQVGNYILEPFLKQSGITEIDGWFLTHPDNDHTSAFRELCMDTERSDISIKTLYIPEILKEEFADIIAMAGQKGVDVVFLSAGDVLGTNELAWSVLSPAEQIFYPDENAASLVLYMQCGEFDGLFMGDAGLEAERLVLDAGIEAVTVLKVGHHGSAIDTNSEMFIRETSPTLAVISCGENNKSTMGSIQFNDTNSVKMA